MADNDGGPIGRYVDRKRKKREDRLKFEKARKRAADVLDIAYIPPKKKKKR